MSEKESNRAAFPAVASMVDELREIFGSGVSLEWAEENGRQIGKKKELNAVQPVIERAPGKTKNAGRRSA